MKNPQQNLLCLILAVAAYLVGGASGGEPPAYRTDVNDDPSLPWFQPVRGEFPPADAAHYISGELIGVDHLKRVVEIRVDRADDQTSGMKDRPIASTLLPYGTVYRHGEPASLQEMPLGTHLHGWFFGRPAGEPNVWTMRNGKLHSTAGSRVSNEIDFTRCLRLEDDFSYHVRRGRTLKVEAVDREDMTLTAVPVEGGKPAGEPEEYDLTTSTTVYKGPGFGSLHDITVGQQVQMNLTWATLYSSGRITEIWLDDESRGLTSARQAERHRNRIRERGLPGWVDAVDDVASTVTITFFDGVDPALFDDFDTIVPEPLGWPTSGGAKDDMKPKGTIAVARDSLLTFDPVNDRKGGNILKTEAVAEVPGCSGVRITVQCGMLLEGYRPGGIVRFFPACWPVVDLPKEEQLFGLE